MTIRQILHALVWAQRHLTGRLSVSITPYIASYVEPDNVLFDIGAHGGVWTRALASLVSDKGHVYAFEALPYYAEVLQLTIKLLRLKNVTVINKAITDRKGVVTLTWKDTMGHALTGRTHITSAADAGTDLIRVNATDLDTFVSLQGIQSRVAFIKGDVEGVELLVVRGASKVIERSRPVFYLEVVAEHCHRYGHDPRDVFQLLSRQGYLGYGFQPAGFFVIDKPSEMFPDVLFVPRELGLPG